MHQDGKFTKPKWQVRRISTISLPKLHIPPTLDELYIFMRLMQSNPTLIQIFTYRYNLYDKYRKPNFLK